ncbi:MAG TPA: serine/threonine-protein kinase [Gemmatimonadaceae bacterium]|nr:serine/threonine-protein kinase [Gemmatimonadaceae bacterium]
MTVPAAGGGASAAAWLSDAALVHLRRVADWPELTSTRYEVVELIARGGMGAVYRARDLELGREVALKVVSLPEDDAAARTLREARTIARLEHPGIVPVHDVGTLADGRVYYTMKLVRGDRLDVHAAAQGTTALLLRIYVRVCEAVAFAHAHGVIHRDLKPQNIMVGAFGEVLVMDWGVAKDNGCEVRIANGELNSLGTPDASRRPDSQFAIRTSQPLEATTLPGTVLGTPGYMAPEQAAGNAGAVDERGDVYALGAILRDLLQVGEAGAAPAPLLAIAARAMAADPGARYQRVTELAADVLAYLEARPVSAHREGLIERARRVGAKYRTPILLVLAYLLMRALLLLLVGPAGAARNGP